MQQMINQDVNQYYRYMPALRQDQYPNPVYQPPDLQLPMQVGNVPLTEQEHKNSLPEEPLPNIQFAGTNAQQPVDPMKPKQKRRSKNEVSGRDYICGCGKTYLSYPALYTHIKTKHSGVNPCGTQQLQAGRGRGRPRKVLLLIRANFSSRTFQDTTWIKRITLSCKRKIIKETTMRLLTKFSENMECWKVTRHRFF